MMSLVNVMFIPIEESSDNCKRDCWFVAAKLATIFLSVLPAAYLSTSSSKLKISKMLAAQFVKPV